jgi:tRNA pseudouridine13 synthase
VIDPTFAQPTIFQTADIEGTGGVIKQRPEDFLVEEIPLYNPCGEGEHIYLFVQKRGLSTFEMLNILANHFGVQRRDIGFAGLKDKHAITRQVVSIHAPGRKPEDFPSLRDDRIEILWTDLHANKLRRGHLASNRFSIRIRNVKPTDVLRAAKVLASLEKTGIANRIGEQRFGLLNNNHTIGRLMIESRHEDAIRELLGPGAHRPDVNALARAAFAAGDYARALDLFPRHAHAERQALRALAQGKGVKRAFFGIDYQMLGFYISAFQSAVFNAVADRRVMDGTLDRLLPGDVAIKHENHACFSVDDPVASDPGTPDRLAKFEISPSGPMWGGGMKRAQGAVDEAELAALNGAGVTLEQVQTFSDRSRNLIQGERRPLRVPVIAPEYEGGLDEHGPYIRCAFELPKGSFATTVMREIMKPETAAPVESQDEDHE